MTRLLAIVAILGAAANAAPFSHKLHLEQLKVKLECVSCHTSAAESTKPQDNLLPDKKQCLGSCHATMDIPAPPTTKLVHFSHQQHLKMGNVAPVIAAAIDKKTYLQPPGDIRAHLSTSNACEACHRGLRESDHVTAANMPQMADCLVCHNQIDNPFSCEKCHEKGAALKPANHVEGFMSSHNSNKSLDRTTCAVCHGTNFHCLGCH
jgi:hypothetical protein